MGKAGRHLGRGYLAPGASEVRCLQTIHRGPFGTHPWGVSPPSDILVPHQTCPAHQTTPPHQTLPPHHPSWPAVLPPIVPSGIPNTGTPGIPGPSGWCVGVLGRAGRGVGEPGPASGVPPQPRVVATPSPLGRCLGLPSAPHPGHSRRKYGGRMRKRRGGTRTRKEGRREGKGSRPSKLASMRQPQNGISPESTA